MRQKPEGGVEKEMKRKRKRKVTLRMMSQSLEDDTAREKEQSQIA